MTRRTRTTAPLLAAAILLGPALTTAAPAAPVSARQGVEANYARFNAAFLRKDLDTMFATLAPDFTMSVPGKTPMNAIQTRQFYDAMVGSMKTVDAVEQTVQSVQPHGRQATAVTRMVLKFTGTEDSRDYHAVQTSTWRDTFVRTPRGWLLRRADNLSMRMTVDGKSVTP